MVRHPRTKLPRLTGATHVNCSSRAAGGASLFFSPFPPAHVPALSAPHSPLRGSRTGDLPLAHTRRHMHAVCAVALITIPRLLPAVEARPPLVARIGPDARETPTFIILGEQGPQAVAEAPPYAASERALDVFRARGQAGFARPLRRRRPASASGRAYPERTLDAAAHTCSGAGFSQHRRPPSLTVPPSTPRRLAVRRFRARSQARQRDPRANFWL